MLHSSIMSQIRLRISHFHSVRSLANLFSATIFIASMASASFSNRSFSYATLLNCSCWADSCNAALCLSFDCVLCEKTKSKYMFRGYTKKVIFGVTVIFGFFLCFDQSDLFCKYRLYLQKKVDER